MSKPRTGAPKRVAVGLLAGALAMFGVALAPSAGASASVATDRIGGTTRYGTARDLAASPTFTAPTLAIVATGENFPDALAASTLAGANTQAPIILTAKSTYSDEAKTALTALKAKGVLAVTIVGGVEAIAQSVEDAIKADGFTVTRIGGDDRFETAASIATAANTKSAGAPVGSPALKTAFVTTGLNSPDALSAGPAAAANKLPILLVTKDSIPAETSNAISTLGIKKVVLLGGTDAVSTTVEAQLGLLTGNTVDRKGGLTRYSTATLIADYEKATLGFPMTSALVANGIGVDVTPPATGKFSPDALAAGPLGGVRKAPVLLTDPTTLSKETSDWLDANSATINSITAVGGTTVVPDTVLAAAKTAAQNVSNDSANKAVTTRPELTGAQVLTTTAATQVTPTNPLGTTVRYTFDEALGTGFAPVAANFKVWSAGNTPTVGNVASIDTGTGTTGTTVTVLFSTITVATDAAALTKATVAFNAVRDPGGAGNPEGEASIGTAGSTPSAAGTTSAPDLKTVGNFRQAARVGQTAIDFTFDQNAFIATTAGFGFHLVDTLNQDHDCSGPTNGDNTTPGGGTIAGGSGTATITVICTNIGGVVDTTAGTAYSASNVARGWLETGTVTSAAGGTGSVTPLEAADVGSITLGPDLASVALSAVAPTTTAIFTFDQTISNATAANFFLYSASGALIAPTALSQVISTADARQVSITYPSTSGAVGGFVTGPFVNNAAPTVASSHGARATDGTINSPDEEGFAGSATTVTPGRTSGPDLTAVALAAIPDAFGTTTGYSATYTFDVAAGTAITGVVNANFHLYLADGSRYNGSSCIAGDGGTTNGPLGTVKCSAFTNDLTGVAPATATTLQAAVVGTVAQAAVTGPNSEGAVVTSGGNGTPAS